ncbi:MAG: hypothetical protein IJE89_02385 [Bacilli bacterium]|nr:hypothetical protein [Bacilli bacterium]
MKNKFKFLLVLLVSIVFTPKVYASFTYDIEMDVDSTSVKKGSVTEIKVSLDNIQGDNDGIVTCSMNIFFDSNILLDSKIRTLNSWTMTTGNFYMFDTGDFVFDRTEMFIIPVKVNGNGSVKLFDIVCSDAVVEEITSDKSIEFTILANDKENNNQGNNTSQNDDNKTEDNNMDGGNKLDTKDSNANLSNIILSEGTIEFDSNVTEYEIEVTDFDKLEVTPIIESDTAHSIIDRNISEEDKSIVITVAAENGDSKTYRITVKEKTLANDYNSNDKEKNNKSYVPIFIGIICILVIINIVRVVKSKQK